MSEIFTGFTKVNNAKWAGGVIRVPEAPSRLVLHTTEVPAANLKRLAEIHEWPPHVWADPYSGERYQSVRRGRSAYALKRVSGGIETNHMGVCIQVELHLRASDTPHLPDHILKWIGENVVWPLCLEAGINWDNVWVPTFGSEAYGVNGPARMSNSQWRNFGGITTHQAVPTNSHWDAGRINLNRIVEHARAFNPFGPNPGGGYMAATDDKVDELWRAFIANYRPSGGGVHNHGFAIQNGNGVLARIEPLIKQIARDTAKIPTDGATSAHVVQAAEDVIDSFTALIDGLEVDGTVVTGDDARRLLAELIGATIP